MSNQAAVLNWGTTVELSAKYLRRLKEDDERLPRLRYVYLYGAAGKVSAATNKTGTTIHAFEYVRLKEAFDVASHEGEVASISGTIETIQPNPNKSKILVLRIYISGASVNLQKQEPQKAAVE